MKDLSRPDQGNCKPNGKGVHREVGSEGSRRQSAGPTNRKRMRRVRWVRRQLALKPETDPESVDVDATVISVKVLHLTRGDLPICEAGKEKTRGARIVARRCEGWAEVSRGHGRSEFDRTEGPNKS